MEEHTKYLVSEIAAEEPFQAHLSLSIHLKKSVICVFESLLFTHVIVASQQFQFVTVIFDHHSCFLGQFFSIQDRKKCMEHKNWGNQKIILTLI